MKLSKFEERALRECAQWQDGYGFMAGSTAKLFEKGLVRWVYRKGERDYYQITEAGLAWLKDHPE